MIGEIDIKTVRNLKENIADKIAATLEENIAAEKWPPGTRLPPDRELAKIFNVTTITLAKALTLLEERGLLNRHVGRGTFVSRIPHTTIGESLRRFWAFNSCSFHEMHRLRELLEPECAALASQYATEGDLQTIALHLEGIRKNCLKNDGEQFALANAAFHEAVAAASRNRLYHAVIAGLHQVICAFIRQHSSDVIEADTIPVHEAIYDALLARDSDAARIAMRRHMKTSVLANSGSRGE